MRGAIDQAIATVRRDGDALSSKKLAGFFVRELDDDEDASGEASILGPTEAVEDVEHAPAAEQSTVRLRNVNVRQLRCAREWRMQLGTVRHEARRVRNEAHFAEVGRGPARQHTKHACASV